MFQYFDTLTDGSGNSLLGATVAVSVYPGGAPATIYATNGTSQPIANSTVSADITGQVSFFAPDGVYILTYTYKGTQYKVRSPVQFIDPTGFLALPDTGAVNAYIVNDSRLSAQLYPGLKIEFIAASTNTGASTLTVNGVGARPLQQPGGSSLTPGMIQSGGITRVEWDGTRFQLIGSQSQPFYATTSVEAGLGVVPTSNAYLPGDLRRYGGAPGGSLSQNNAALSAAILVCGSYPIYFSAGTWQYSIEPWFQSSNVRIYGDGIGVTVLQPNGWIDGLRFADNQYPNAATVLTHITVHDLTIDGTNQTAGANDTNGNGINFNACDYVDCQRCEMRSVANQSWVSTYYNVGGYGVQQSLICAHNLIRMIAGTNTVGIGIEGQASFTLVDGNVITNCQNVGILAANYGGSAATNGRLIITNNVVQGPTSSATQGIVVQDIMFHTLVQGNLVDGFNISIGVFSFAGAGSVFDTNLVGNYCKDWTANAIFVQMKANDNANALVSSNFAISSVASGSSRAISVDRGTTVTANKVLSGNTGIFCLNGGGSAPQRLIGNHISITSGLTVDCSSTIATGVIGQGNILENAAGVIQSYPSLNSDTIWEWTSGWGGALASTAALVLPAQADTFNITGTTNITSIFAGQQQGRSVKLTFAGVLTVTAGSNLKLKSAANFVTAAGSWMELWSDGTNWYERDRGP